MASILARGRTAVQRPSTLALPSQHSTVRNNGEALPQGFAPVLECTQYKLQMYESILRMNSFLKSVFPLLECIPKTRA